jgi:hypothetical protein
MYPMGDEMSYNNMQGKRLCALHSLIFYGESEVMVFMNACT